MGIDEVEKVYEKIKELEKKQEQEKFRWAMKWGDIETVKKMAKKHHEEKLKREEETAIKKIYEDMLKNQN